MLTARFGTMVMALAAAFSLSADAQVMEDRTAAVEAASAWLTLVDSGEYGESWDEAAELFRASMGRDRWVTTLDDVRGPLGAVLTRTVGSAEFTTELPGAPPGAYVVIQFETNFANLQNAVETVTPMRDRDGRWRVSGYFIRQARWSAFRSHAQVVGPPRLHEALDHLPIADPFCSHLPG